MASIHFHLLGNFQTVWDGRTIHPIDSNKARELLCYLLLYRRRAHPREALAGMLWGDLTTAQSRTYLRKALWQIQTAFEAIARDFLVIDTEWVRINPQLDLWLDAAVLEEAFQRVEGIDGEQLDAPAADTLKEAVEIYDGDLLEGWYQDWCLYERERLQNIYLALLDKLMGYCEVRQYCEQGLAYGSRALRYDRAREQTHRRLMRLYYIAGDRTAALRQYEHCVTALSEEFDLEPTDTTKVLYAQIRANRLDDLPVGLAPASGVALAAANLADAVAHLKQLQEELTELQRHIAIDIDEIEQGLRSHQTDKASPIHLP